MSSFTEITADYFREVRKDTVGMAADAADAKLARNQYVECGHRPRISGFTPSEILRSGPAFEHVHLNSRFLPAAVQAKVPRNRWKEPGAQAALDEEWRKLEGAPWPNGLGKGAWGDSLVREFEDVRREAKQKGETPPSPDGRTAG